jgi:prepilin-type N-terminal cleavage/methylation domain-containing protein
MFSKIKSTAGFTLVEMMVVAGIIAVLAIGFASYLYQQSNQLKAGQARQSIAQVQIDVLSASGKPDGLLKSEALQIQALATPTEFRCPHPCWLEPADSENCIFRCGDPSHPESNHCPSSLPPPCVGVGSH